MAADPDFWRGRRVLLTGHTGFKGTWCARWLGEMGAEVTGFALAPDTDPAMAEMVDIGADSIIADLRDRAAVVAAVKQTMPQIVLHLAAQPLVRASYDDPVGTFATNTMGTVHLLDALRDVSDLQAVLIVTTDKVYENDDTGTAFCEDAPLGGHDPYAASKAAAEIAVASFARSFFAEAGVPVATARGGNVIGGGDFADDRLVPDIIRALRAGGTVSLRNPDAVRPWQHVLDCLDGYLTFAQALVERPDAPRALNIGPHDPTDVQTVAQVTRAMHGAMGVPDTWAQDTTPAPHAMATLALNPARARDVLGWQGRMGAADAIRLTADWYAAWVNGADMTAVTDTQIQHYRSLEPTP